MTKCSVSGCEKDAEWGDLCYPHFEEYSDRLWWEQVRACAFATASNKNQKAKAQVTK